LNKTVATALAVALLATAFAIPVCSGLSSSADTVEVFQTPDEALSWYRGSISISWNPTWTGSGTQQVFSWSNGTQSATFDFTYNYSLSPKVELTFDLDKATGTIGGAVNDLDVSGKLTATALPAGWTYQKEKDLFSRPFATIGGVIGVVPVWVTLWGRVALGVEANVVEAITGTATVGLNDIKGSLYNTTTVRWGGGFSVTNSVSRSFSWGTPSYSWNVGGRVHVKPYVSFEGAAYLYTAIGPRIAIQPYLLADLKGSGGSSGSSFTWDLDLRLRALQYVDAIPINPVWSTQLGDWKLADLAGNSQTSATLGSTIVDARASYCDANLGADADTIKILLVSQHVALDGYLGGSDTQDCYYVRARANQVIDLQLKPPAGADFNLQLYNPSGTLVASSYRAGNAEDTVTYTAPTSGDYKVRVYIYSGSGTYALHSRLSGTESYPDFNRGTDYTGDMCTHEFTAFCSLSSSDTEDWIYPKVWAGQTITVTIKPPAGADFNLQLYNPSGTLVASSYRAGNAEDTVTYTAPTSGDYKVRVYIYSGSGTYAISMYIK